MKLGKLKDMIFEDASTTAPAIPPTPAMTPSHFSDTSAVLAGVSAPFPSAQLSDDKFYQGLLNATDPQSKTSLGPLLAAVQSLESIIEDRSKRFQAAQVTSHVTKSAITLDVQALRDKLAEEKTRFDQHLADATKTLVADAQSHADDIRRAITAQQEELKQIVVGIESTKNKLAQSAEQFAAALAHRSAEIESLARDLETLK